MPLSAEDAVSAGIVVPLVVFTAEGRKVAGAVGAGTVASEVESFKTEFLPNENPKAKNTAHSVTSPKNKASSLPVPSVISVSSDVAAAIATS